MGEEKDAKTETKLKGKDIVNATDFGKLVGCSLQGVKRMFGSKLTEGKSYLVDGRSILIDVEAAKVELMATVKASTCKNKKLLEFLDIPDTTHAALEKRDVVDGMTAQRVREELNKSELRLSWIQERVQEGKYIERKVVEKNLEAMGIEIRNQFTGISARVTPSMRAAANDRDAENVIHIAIEDILSGLANILHRDLATP